ncbi:MAG: hypothetical protein J0M00_07020 [Burkholderiales bacterium]|nr:hypothetical protein [Burkholderiales bacterium]
MDMTTILKGLDKIEAGLGQVNELADRVLQLEQRGVVQPGGTPPVGASLGADFAREFANHRESFKRNRALSLEISTKGLISAAQVGARVSLGATPGGDLPQTLPAVAMRSIPLAGAQSLIYARRTGVVLGEESAGVQNGEGAAKTERTPEYTSITQNRATVAGYANLSEQSLSSDAELRTAIDVFLQTDVLRAASVLLVNGTTVASAAFAGFRDLAMESIQTTGLTLSAPTLEIVASRGAMQMRAQGYNPTLMIVDPLNWGEVVTRHGDNGWFNGSPFDMPPLMFSGMRVCFSEAVDADEPLLVDERYAHWAIADTMRVDLGYVNDNFIKNVVTVRAELGMIPILRDAHAVWRVKKFEE